jgi:hypothetical protein
MLITLSHRTTFFQSVAEAYLIVEVPLQALSQRFNF